MYNSLTGVISRKQTDSLCLTIGGVEWILEVSASTLVKSPPLGEEASFFIYLLHREDTMRLYGFLSEKERTLFLELIKVNGISTQGARKILSHIEEDSLVQLLESEDVKGLSSIPGIGNKTAQKMILQLKGSLVSFAPRQETPSSRTPLSLEGVELSEALTAMGFDRKKTEKTVLQLLNEGQFANLSPKEREQNYLKEAIVRLSQPLF